jgi:hypothetical protein
MPSVVFRAEGHAFAFALISRVAQTLVRLKRRHFFDGAERVSVTPSATRGLHVRLPQTLLCCAHRYLSELAGEVATSFADRYRCHPTVNVITLQVGGWANDDFLRQIGPTLNGLNPRKTSANSPTTAFFTFILYKILALRPSAG